jgi:hypothetical protein
LAPLADPFEFFALSQQGEQQQQHPEECSDHRQVVERQMNVRPIHSLLLTVRRAFLQSGECAASGAIMFAHCALERV